MKSVIIDDYEAKPPEVHPARPEVLMLGFYVPDSYETYVFPMSRDHAEKYYEALGQALNKPKIHMPSQGDINATRAR